jgi:Zn-dependent M32 family carboxypeptidase
MSKRAFKKYISSLPREELEGQLLNLYDKFPGVKKYYDFIFNPREEDMVGEAKAKIRNEYFPHRRKRPRARRSVAQKYIKQFRKLEMDAIWVAELMLFNLETAQAFEEGKRVPDTFYKSMLNSFEELVQFVSLNRILPEYRPRIIEIYRKVQERDWLHAESFSKSLQVLD